MKLDSDIKGLVRGVSVGCAILCSAEVVIGIVLLSTGGFGLELSAMSVVGILLGAVGGSLVAALVFHWMAVSLQKSLDDAVKTGKTVQRGVQVGYTQRLFAQGAWVVVAILVPFINTIAALIPLLFPRLAIYGLQAMGKLNSTQVAAAAPASQAASAAAQQADTQPAQGEGAAEVQAAEGTGAAAAPKAASAAQPDSNTHTSQTETPASGSDNSTGSKGGEN